MIQELANLLETLQKQHEQLIELADMKRSALMANQIDQLNEVTTKESRLIKQITDTESSRQRAVTKVLLTLGIIPRANTTLSDIVTYLPSLNDKRTLMNALTKLSAVVSELKQKNEMNTALVQTAKAFNDFSLDLLLGGNEPDYIYGKPAVPQGSRSRSGRFDSKA